MSKIGHIQTGDGHQDPHVLSVKNFIKSLYNDKQDASLVFHNFKKAVEAETIVNELAEEGELQESVRTNATIMAWFYFSGFILDYENAERKTVETIKQFYNTRDFDTGEQERIIQVIQSYWKKEEPRGDDAKLFFDALNSIYFGESFFEYNPIWRLERELTSGKKISKTAWENQLLNRLLQLKFYTIPAQLRFGQHLSNNILTIKRKIEKRRNEYDLPEASLPGQRFGNIESRTPIRAVQTYLRTAYRNHINLYAIADKKANIMISVNSIMISVVISIVSYRNVIETKPVLLLPTVIFIVSGLSSLIFAVLSARPKLSSAGKKLLKGVERDEDLIFFGNYVQLDEDEFEEAMSNILLDGHLLYGNMIKEVYRLGKVLDSKFKFLTISYNIFMVGFITTILFFLILLFL